jgi:hypothetical protein
MKKTFDQICADILGETLQPNAQNNATQQQPPAGQQYQKTPPIAPKQPGQQTDPEVESAFKTLLAKAGQNQDQQKAIQALQQLLTQQQNAANKPA